ncbi:MAG: dethiobiotin synthase [Candidatus Omnitrophica bacterium]|nr:dethiobiotin synthase [Candidatus Omnitrophota bacterium]
MKAIFITGTDTAVGKTIVCGLIARYFKEQGYNVITQKWFQTGGFLIDIKTHLKIMGEKINVFKKYIKYLCPYILKFPSSPHLAAKLEGKKILKNKIKESFNYLLNKFDFVIVEGTGGVLVPYNKKNLSVEIVKELNLPTVVVVANRLGAINHTLLTIEVIQKRQIKILGLIFNNLIKNENDLILEDNIKIIKKLTRKNIFGVLPYEENIEVLYKKFLSIGKKIFSALKNE